MFTRIKKRDGREVPYDREKIAAAISKAMVACNRRDNGESEQMAKLVEERLIENFGDKAPGVEDIQDTVETILMNNGYAMVSKKYIIYRAERSRARGMPSQVRSSRTQPSGEEC